MDNTDQISSLLGIILIAMIVILVILIVVYIVLKIKMSQSKEKKEKKIETKPLTTTTTTTSSSYNKQSIFHFMEFDKIEDNMIVRKNGNNYVMVIECQGINYDLMSSIEKNSVEQGFIQFLNTLRYPIQIYVQTRTVNLESGIIKYKERVKNVKNRILNKQMEINQMRTSGYSEEELKDVKLELMREQNLYEYGIDIINNTERMSLNKNILRKHYYVIISYTPEQLSGDFVQSEISNMAFSELYTKAQTIISALAVSGVKGKILDSTQLAELLYIAYNRDESELYNLDKALEVGFDQLYRTAPDVLDKRIKVLDEKIKEEAIIRANQAVEEAIQESEKERQVKEKEKEMNDLINQMAKIILSENENIVGKEIADKAKSKIKTKSTKKTKEKEVKNEKKQKAK